MSLLTLPSPTVLGAFCEARGMARLRLFGSAVRDGFDPSLSDVDLLVPSEILDRWPAVPWRQIISMQNGLTGISKRLF